MRVIRLLVSASLIVSSFIALAAIPASAGQPTVTVSPSTGLVHGETVVVRVHGLPPHTWAGIAECDDLFIAETPPGNCAQVGSLTTNGRGRGASGVTLVDNA